MELLQESQRVLDAGDIFEVLVNVLLQLSLHCGHVDIELHKVSVEGVLMVVQ